MQNHFIVANRRNGDAKRPRLVRFAAVGDLLLSVDPPGGRVRRDPTDIFAGVVSVLRQHDIVFGNLECTLPGNGPTVSTEPRVISNAELVMAIEPAGFNVVSLANNHMFDHLQKGFHRLRGLLSEMGVACFGAGDNIGEAAAPAILEVGSARIGFLGAADQRSGAQYFASADHWGVAPLDTEAMCNQIHQLRERVDHVIVSLHWGEERFLIPAPEQIEQAHAFVDAGASMVVGHHPHVLQGLERYNHALIVYSLGNFVAGQAPFSDGDVLTWNRTERTGCILSANLTPDAVSNVHQYPTLYTGEQLQLDRSSFGERLIHRANSAIACGVTLRRYRRQHLWVKTIRPVLSHIRWGKLKKLRFRQVRNAVRAMLQSRKAR